MGADVKRKINLDFAQRNANPRSPTLELSQPRGVDGTIQYCRSHLRHGPVVRSRWGQDPPRANHEYTTCVM